MNVLGLFSGIGGFELGFQRAGFTIAAMCEIEPYCQAVLRKHWPGVPIFGDVRQLTGPVLELLDIDVITGGFPCQDISLAGKGAGLTGQRSSLWYEMHRVIAEVHPSWVVVENVSALRSRGLDKVLGSLAAIGYDAEWHCISAAAVGAPHRRDRIWIVAYPARLQPRRPEQRAVGERSGALPDANSQPQGRLAIARGECGQWLVEPDVGRVAHGVPARVDRLRALGNAVVPQIPEIIARAILACDPAATQNLREF